MQNPLFPLLILAALTGATRAQSIKDALLKTDGARVRGIEITATTASQVSFKRGGNDESLPADQVEDIEWYDPPDTFGEALAAEARGDFASAANLFQEAIDGTERDVLKQDSQFRAASALVAAAQSDPSKAGAAADALNAFLTAAPDSFRLPAAKLALGRALRLQGKGAEAEAALTQLEQDAVTNSWGFRWDAEAKFERALAQMAQEKHADARSTFRGVVSAIDAALASTGANARLAALRSRAAVAEGETHIAEKDYDGAVTFYRRLGGNADLQAAALAGEGQALFLKAEAAKDEAGLRQARMALAKANLLDTTAGETSAKALFFSGKVLLALGDKARDSKSRAMAYFDTVARAYPETPWAAQARAARGQ